MKRSVHFILASSSPRRIDLLKQVGIEPQVLVPNIDETPLPGETPRGLVQRLAFEKAISVHSQKLKTGQKVIILAADTTVVAPDRRQILGKPAHPAEARKMLQLLSGKTHTVLTGYCILQVTGEKSYKHLIGYERSRVTLRELSPTLISRYIATGEPMDKAGSYGAQGYGASLIRSISGNYTNVVGLPIAQILWELQNHFQVPFLSWKK